MENNIDNQLYNDYGFIILKKGMVLYHNSKELHDNNTLINRDHIIFFTVFQISSFGQYKYKAILKKNIKLLLAIKQIDNYGNIISSLDDIYKKYINSNEDIDDLIIKKDIMYRKKIIKFFKDINILGWYTSLENGSITEICLFTSDIYELQLIIDSSLQYTNNIYDITLNLGTIIKYNKNILIKKYKNKIISTKNKDFPMLFMNYHNNKINKCIIL
jgi:hypothetical protein